MAERISGKKAVFRRALQSVGRFRFLIALSLLFSAAGAVLSLYIPVLAGRAIDCISEQGATDWQALYRCLITIVICAASTGVFQWLMSIMNNRIAYKTVQDMRNTAFDHIQRLPISYIDSHAYGETVSRIITDADQFADGLLLGFSQLFSGVVTIIVTLIFMLLINPIIAAVVVMLTPVSLLVARFIAKHTYSMFRKQSEIRAEQTALVGELIQNQKTVQAFSYEKTAVKRFDEVNERLKKSSLKAVFYSSLTNPTTRFVNNLIYAAVGLTGAVSVIRGLITVGGFVSFLAYANQYTKPFNEISGVVTELQNALACAGRLYELIDQPAEEPDKPDAVSLAHAAGAVSLADVCFSYDKSRRLLEHLNLRAEPGKRIAIVGPTGCGKTTLINLLLRFYEVDAGEILVDGIPLSGMTRQSLRRNFGMVLQDTWIMEGTVRENIAFGKPDASEEEVERAARAAHAHGFIKRMKYGYHTVIGEESSLSEGERQLISIARVMLMQPPMLILDEATSSIDTLTELKVQDAFARLMKGRTCFVVAHRLSTVMDADTILVMKDGNIIEQGSHEELMQKGGFYQKLFRSMEAGTAT